MINRDNYEIWFMDYLDGTLNEADKEQLQCFLKLNPDKEEELKQIELLVLKPDNKKYVGKQALKKHALHDTDAFNTSCIDYIEGNADNKQKAGLLAFTLANPEKAAELRRFQATRLKPDFSIIYPFKQKLYKRGIVVPLRRVMQLAAAMVILAMFASAGWFYNSFFNLSPILVKHSGPGISPTQQIEHTENNGIQPKMDNAPVYGDSGSMTYHTVQQNKIPKQPAMLTQRSPQSENNLEKLHLIQPRMKPTLLVFDAGKLQKAPQSNTPEEQPRLLAGLLNGRTNTDAYKKTATQLQDVRIAPSVLNLLGEVSADRLTYNQKQDGKISEINYESRLLSFSVPIRSHKN